MKPGDCLARVVFAAISSAALLTFACGGRYETTRELAEGGSGGTSSGGSVSGSSTGGGGIAAGNAGNSGGGAACLPCPTILCSTGYHQETAASDCCPHCAVDANANACLEGQQQYATQRQQMADKYSYGCASSSECASVTLTNACEQGCGYAAIWYGNTDSFKSNLSSLANMSCSTCMRGLIPSCFPAPAPTCVNGRCTQ